MLPSGNPKVTPYSLKAIKSVAIKTASVFAMAVVEDKEPKRKTKTVNDFQAQRHRLRQAEE